MSLPGQSLELYRYTAQSLAQSYNSDLSWKNSYGFIEAAVLVLSTGILSAVLLWAASVLYWLLPKPSQNGSAAELSLAIFSLIASVPSLGVAIGIYRSAIDKRSPQLIDAMRAGASVSFAKDLKEPQLIAKFAELYVNSQLSINGWLYAGAVAMLLISLLWSLLPFVLSGNFSKRGQLAPTAAIRLIVCGTGLPILLSVIFVLFPVGLPRALSAFAAICLFFATAAIFLVAISILQERVKMPLLFLLLVSAIGFNLARLNNNHGIRELDSGARPQNPMPQTIGDGFVNWLKERKDRDRYEAYPVYIVAAEGGGIYAAFRTAVFLASLQDLCPRFSHHLFAISSVSGGSVGAAIYSGLAQKIKQGSERFEAGRGCRGVGENVNGLFFTDVAEEILQDDFLSPVLTAFLFPDFLQRFLFFPIPQLDRARTLEKSLEQSWDDKVRDYYTRFRDQWVDDQDPLREPFSQSWTAGDDSPALFINTTEIQSGRGRVIAPFLIEAEEFSNLPLIQSSQNDQDRGVDLSLSTAAVLSARFPWLTPPGSVQIPALGTDRSAAATATNLRKEIQLVDGGYLDNSGVTTALTIVQSIDAAVARANPPIKIELNLIVLTSGEFSNPEVAANDYMAPIQAMLSTRTARSKIAIEQAEHLIKQSAFDGQQSSNSVNTIAEAALHGYGYPLPLGWRLSPITRLLILGQNGDRSNCKSDKDSSDCLVAKIYNELER